MPTPATASFATPIGWVRLAGDDAVLTSIRIHMEGTPERGAAAAIVAARDQIEQWFAGERTGFDLPLAPALTLRGAVLRDGIAALRYGQTTSYGHLARAIGSSPRAIGQACARNPFPLVIPCHRVLATGGLGAYSAGQGPSTKQWLLDHERSGRSA